MCIAAYSRLSLSLPAFDLKERLFCYCRQVCHENLRPPLPADAPADLVHLITAMWDKSPRKRPSLADILAVVTPHLAIDMDKQDDTTQSSVDTSTTTVTMRQQPSVNMDTDNSNTSSSAYYSAQTAYYSASEITT